MIYLVYFFLGLMVGVIIMITAGIQSTVGVLRIDHSNPEKDTYRFEIADLDNLSRKKRVSLRVDNRADLSQK